MSRLVSPKGGLECAQATHIVFPLNRGCLGGRVTSGGSRTEAGRVCNQALFFSAGQETRSAHQRLAGGEPAVRGNLAMSFLFELAPL